MNTGTDRRYTGRNFGKRRSSRWSRQAAPSWQ